MYGNYSAANGLTSMAVGVTGANMLLFPITMEVLALIVFGCSMLFTMLTINEIGVMVWGHHHPDPDWQ